MWDLGRNISSKLSEDGLDGIDVAQDNNLFVLRNVRLPIPQVTGRTPFTNVVYCNSVVEGHVYPREHEAAHKNSKCGMSAHSKHRQCLQLKRLLKIRHGHKMCTIGVES